MPTVLREDGFRVLIYTDDHSPAHVHVLKSGGSAKIRIDGPEPEAQTIRGLAPRDRERAYDLVVQHHHYLLQKWEEIHGSRR